MKISSSARCLKTRDSSTGCYAYAVLKHGGTVHLVHVIPALEPRHVLNREKRRQQAKRVKECTETLKDLVPPEASLRGIMTEVQVLIHENASQALCEAGERFGADLMVVAPHDRGKLVTAIKGSVVESLMSKSRRPLLVVHPGKP
jgi:nucleotide-binding universal stress UspA family protein